MTFEEAEKYFTAMIPDLRRCAVTARPGCFCAARQSSSIYPSSHTDQMVG